MFFSFTVFSTLLLFAVPLAAQEPVSESLALLESLGTTIPQERVVLIDFLSDEDIDAKAPWITPQRRAEMRTVDSSGRALAACHIPGTNLVLVNSSGEPFRMAHRTGKGIWKYFLAMLMFHEWLHAEHNAVESDALRQERDLFRKVVPLLSGSDRKLALRYIASLDAQL